MGKYFSRKSFVMFALVNQFYYTQNFYNDKKGTQFIWGDSSVSLE